MSVPSVQILLLLSATVAFHGFELKRGGRARYSVPFKGIPYRAKFCRKGCSITTNESDALITLPLVKCVHSICSKGSPNAPPSLPPREGGAFRGALGANEQIE